MPTIDELRGQGQIGGRTVQINDDGSVACAVYDPAPLPAGSVRVRTVRSAISPGTESTYLGRAATNVHLSRQWNADLRLFEEGSPSVDYPITFGYRAAGIVVESHGASVVAGARIWGNWRHTEFVTLAEEVADRQRVPDGMSWDDAVDVGQMGPICVNAAAFAEGQEAGQPAVVIGAGPIGLMTAQIVRAGSARPVVVVDRRSFRLEIARGLGLDVLHADAGMDVAATLKRRFGADGIPVAWECSGAVSALAEAIRVVARRGLVIAVGFYQGGASDLRLGDEFHHNGVRLVSAQIGNPHGAADRRQLQERALELIADGRLVAGGLPRDVVPVEEAAAAFERLRHPDEVLQVALDYGPAA